MSVYTRVVTARDVLYWALDQGVFTSELSGADGPWPQIGSALITAAGEGLVSSEMPIDPRGDAFDFFEEFVAAHCLNGIVEAFKLNAEQTQIVMQLASEIRLFFDASTIFIDDSGLDGPVQGDLQYQCTVDYNIEIPSWAAARAAEH